jgi:hypothetical protein
MARNSLGYTDNTIEVQMTVGPAYPAIVVTVSEFRPLTPEILLFSYIDKGSSNDSHKISLSYAPPIGILDDEKSDLKVICLKYIQSVLNQDHNSREWTFSNTSEISWNLLKAINSYRKSSSEVEEGVSCSV